MVGYHQRLKLLAVVTVTLSAMVFVSTNRSTREIASSSSVASKQSPVRKTDQDGIVRFDCPQSFKNSMAVESGGTAYYANVSKDITTDKKQFLATFREIEYDQWGKTYKRVKELMSPFKSKYYPKYLKEGMHVYESASGIGLNLYMTLEILQEQTGVSGITVYGNEYVEESVARANEVVLADGVIPAGNRLGGICAADSLNLSHVPADSFDLVYCGHISAFLDPLLLHTNEPEWDDWTQYDQICEALDRIRKEESHKKDWMAEYLWERAIVKKQNDWYGSWVGEMARIAKPGAPVIVEQVSVPYCVYMGDWGGVLKEFWYQAARENTYNWNVDPDSIEMTEDAVHEQRYHVVMIKNE